MNGYGKAALATLAMLLIGYGGIHAGVLPGSAASVERKLLASTANSLDGATDWVSVTADGQKIILSGVAPTEEARADVVSAAKTAQWNGGILLGGVTAIDASGVVIKEAPATIDGLLWTAEYAGGSLILSGYAPNDTALNLMVNAARRSFPDAELVNSVEVAPANPPHEDWTTAVSTSLHALTRMEEGAVSASGRDFTLSGAAPNDTTAQVLQNLMAAMPPGFNGAANIKITSPAPETAPRVDNIPELSTADAEDTLQACTDRFASTIRGQTVNFESNRTTIEPASRRFLSALADAALACPGFAIEISGHTDSSGNEDKNQRLSRDRADAVAAYLAAHGVSTSRMTTMGLGSSLPIVSNETVFGRAQNRRIEFVVTYDPSLTGQE